MSKTMASASEFDSMMKSAGDKLVVVDFTASWCGPCKAIAPTFESLAKSNPNIVFVKVDVDQNQPLAKSKTGVGFQGAGQSIGGRSVGTGAGQGQGAAQGGIIGLISQVPKENLLPFVIIIGYLAYVVLGKS